MTTKAHTDITVGAPANAAVINAPLGQIDSALADLASVLGDYVVTGGLAGTSASLVLTQPALRAFIQNTYVVQSATTLTATASKDNYIDLDSAGVYHISVVNNGAAAPAVFALSIRLYKAVASATAVTSVVDLRAGPNLVAQSVSTQAAPFSPYVPHAGLANGFQAMPYGVSPGISVGPTSVNLQARGADMSGAVAMDSVWTACLAELPSGGGQLYAPPGILNTAAGLTTPQGVSLLCAGSNDTFPEIADAPVTLIKYTGASSASAFVLRTDNTKPYIGTLRGFMVDAQYLAGFGVLCQNGSGYEVSDINVAHATAAAVALQTQAGIAGALSLCRFDRVFAHDSNVAAWLFKGADTNHAVTVNTLTGCRGSCNGGANPHSYDFAQFADSNTLLGGRAEGNVNNAVGFIFNSVTPASDLGVYSNRVIGMSIDQANGPTGQVAVIQNGNATFVNLLLACSFGGVWNTPLSITNNGLIYIDMCSGFLPAKRSVTAGASPFTYTNRDGYQETMMVTAVNGMSALTYKTQTGAAITAGIPFILNPADTFVMTWVTTAPVFEILPMPVT